MAANIEIESSEANFNLSATSGFARTTIDRKPVTSEVVTQAQLRTAAELQAAVWLAEKSAREEVQGFELRIRGGATVEPDHPAKVGKR